jgi:hypothetical protein
MQTMLERGLENPKPFIINKDDVITRVHLITTALTAQVVASRIWLRSGNFDDDDEENR